LRVAKWNCRILVSLAAEIETITPPGHCSRSALEKLALRAVFRHAGHLPKAIDKRHDPHFEQPASILSVA